MSLTSSARPSIGTYSASQVVGTSDREISGPPSGAADEDEVSESVDQATGQQFGYGIVNDHRGSVAVDGAAGVEHDQFVDVQQGRMLPDQDVKDDSRRVLPLGQG